MWHIPGKVDFYITNVCNLTCEGCNRFNNYDFRGWQRWSDYARDYAQWSKLVKLKAVTIMGGEPFLNPTLADWITGINQLFGVEVQVLTNGTRFAQAQHIYETMLYCCPRNRANNHIGVSLHNPDQLEQLDSDIKSFLRTKCEVYPKGHPSNKYNADYAYIDKKNVMVNVYIVDKFSNSTLKKTVMEKPRFQLHNSDPQKAHNNCSFAQFKSYHFIRGKLYKCGPVALLPEFDQQHNLDISDEDRILINSYQPLTTDNFRDYHEEFFANINNPIPQCKFCPESYQFTKIYPVKKGLVNV